MPIKRIDLTIEAKGEAKSGRTTMLMEIADLLRMNGYQVDDSGATKSHSIVASYPQNVSTPPLIVPMKVPS